MMASSPRNYYYPNGLRSVVAVVILIIFSITFLPSVSVGAVFSSNIGDDHESEMKQRKPVLGSRPPQCINKCSSCRPCEAALVVPPHRKRSSNSKDSISQLIMKDEEDTYYLVSWKCKCGNKLYQP